MGSPACNSRGCKTAGELLEVDDGLSEQRLGTRDVPA